MNHGTTAILKLIFFVILESTLRLLKKKKKISLFDGDYVISIAFVALLSIAIIVIIYETETI